MGSDQFLERVRTKPVYKALALAAVVGSLAWAVISADSTSKPVTEQVFASVSAVDSAPSLDEYLASQSDKTQESRREWIFDNLETDDASKPKKSSDIPLMNFLDDNNISYDVVHGRLFLDKEIIQQIGELKGISYRKIMDYVSTEDLRQDIFHPMDDNPNEIKAVIIEESHAQKGCNPLLYCSETQIGVQSATNVLRVLTQYSYHGTGTEYNGFRKQLGKKVGSLTELLDAHTDNYVSELADLNQKISRARIVANNLHQSLGEEIIAQGGNPEETKLREEIGMFSRFLKEANEYFVRIVSAQELDVEKVKNGNRKRELRRINARAESLGKDQLKRLRQYENHDFSDVIKDMGLAFGTDFSDLNPSKLKTLYTGRFSPERTLDTFTQLWENAKVREDLNINIGRTHLLHSGYMFEEDQNNNPDKFAGIDPTVGKLEYFNKGRSTVFTHVMAHGKLPPSGYSKKVLATFQSILEINELLYGHPEMECTRIGSGVECKLPEAIQDYVSMAQKD